MLKINIKKQINKLYALTMVGYFQIAGASWVALLALRGFSMLEIGVLESIFHVVSSIFEIPSGMIADVCGRRKTLALARFVSVISNLLMILSVNFGTVALAIGFSAISYNLESGTREALAYDSLKSVNRENDYNKFASTEMMLYRITSSLATLCAGFGLWLGYKRAYALDIFFGLIAMGVALSLNEISVEHEEKIDSIRQKLKKVIVESWGFLIANRKARGIMLLNAFCMTFTGNPYVMIAGGFVGSFADDFLEVRTDVILNDMIPSGQRATLISVSSFTFSIVMIVMSTLMGSIM